MITLEVLNQPREHEIDNSHLVLGGAVVDFSDIDMNQLINEIESVQESVAKISEEFTKAMSLDTTDSHGTRTIVDVIADVEQLMVRPDVIAAMQYLDSIAAQFYRMCAGDDGHGHVLGNGAASLFQHGQSFLTETSNHTHESENTESSKAEDESDDDSEDDYEWVIFNGKLVKRKKAKRR